MVLVMFGMRWVCTHSFFSRNRRDSLLRRQWYSRVDIRGYALLDVFAAINKVLSLSRNSWCALPLLRTKPVRVDAGVQPHDSCARARFVLSPHFFVTKTAKIIFQIFPYNDFQPHFIVHQLCFAREFHRCETDALFLWYRRRNVDLKLFIYLWLRLLFS